MNTYNRAKEIQNVRTQLLPIWGGWEGFLFNAFNCMKAYSYNGERYGYYGYDASGERTYKYDIFSAGSWTNEAGGMNVSLQIDKMMLYPNGYLNMNQNGEYTKHYYADALRIASKIGSGFSQNLCYEANQIGNEVDPGYLDVRMNKQQDEMMEELTELINGNQIMDINPIPYPEADLCNLFGDEREDALFFYHPDHLGSTGMVTDNSSNITQGFLYAPFGEIITEFNPSWESGRIPKYSFNAKELDEENGMYYYSARYYAPPTFISRDPMFEKYPSISPYTYCGNNPVGFVDPTGKFFTEKERNAAVGYMRSNIGTPYQQLDCSAAAANAVVAAGLPNPKTGTGVDGWDNGVALIVGNSRKVNITEIRVGDMATFRSGRSDHKGENGEYDHIGVISNINRDDKGNITSFSFIHATSKGLIEQTYDMEKGMAGFELRDFYQWDTPDNETSTPSSQTNASFNPLPDPTFIDKIKDSKVPILKTVGWILDAITGN